MILNRLVPKFRLLSGLESDPNILINCKANSLGMVQLQPIFNQLQSAVSEKSIFFQKTKLFCHAFSQGWYGGTRKMLRQWKRLGKSFCQRGTFGL